MENIHHVICLASFYCLPSEIRIFHPSGLSGPVIVEMAITSAKTTDFSGLFLYTYGIVSQKSTEFSYNDLYTIVICCPCGDPGGSCLISDDLGVGTTRYLSDPEFQLSYGMLVYINMGILYI